MEIKKIYKRVVARLHSQTLPIDLRRGDVTAANPEIFMGRGRLNQKRLVLQFCKF